MINRLAISQEDRGDLYGLGGPLSQLGLSHYAQLIGG